VERRLSVLLAFVALGVVFAAPASSGDGIKMRQVRGVCHPVCFGDRAPAWSPDGKTIAFIRRTRGMSARTIFTVPANGGAARRVFAPSTRIIPEWIAWSPDSTRLAFRTFAGSNYVVPAAGGTPVLIRPPVPTGPDLYSDGRPAWSPDGTRLAFARSRYAGRFEDPRLAWCCQLWVAAADVSGATEFGGPAPEEWLTEPAWAPDGRIAFLTGPRTPDGNADLSRAEIWIANADGSDRRRLAPAFDDQRSVRQLSWSADGSRLAFAMETSIGWTLLWVASDGERLGGIGDIRRERWFPCCPLAFGPDGTRAVYWMPGADGAMEVHVTGERESNRRIADGISSQSRPSLTTASWSPDGKRVTYISDGECPTELAVHTIDVQSKEIRRLTRPCRIVGTGGANTLRGTSRTDALYGRGGNDTLQALGSPDFLQGGTGRDRVFGGPGDDRVYGGPGADRLDAGQGLDAVYSRDGVADVVRCGADKDAVRADSRDWVARDCELVERE
jgi:Tol biopolymer transport system component